MIELIIEPAQFLIDALQNKTASQLIDLIHQSAGCDRLASIAIHLTACDMLLQRYPAQFEEHFSQSKYFDDTTTCMD